MKQISQKQMGRITWIQPFIECFGAYVGPRVPLLDPRGVGITGFDGFCRTGRGSV